MKTYLGMDFGGTKLLIGEVDEQGNILRSKRYPTGCGDQEDALRVLTESTADYRKTVGFAGEVKAGGIGIVGVSDNAGGLWISMTHIVTGPPVPICRQIEEILQIPIAVDNDVRSATTAELLLGNGRRSQNFIYLNVGTGLAAGIVSGGRLLRGVNHNSGEIGHMSVDFHSDEECVCGRYGCAETMVSGAGFTRQVIRYGRTDLLTGTDRKVADTRRLFDLAAEGDEVCQKIFETAADTLACVIMNLVRTSDPDTVVLGGGNVSDGRLLALTKTKLVPSAMRGVTHGVVLSEFHPDHVGLLGAASLGMGKSGVLIH